MAMLLQELDQGPAALPSGSELTLFNSRDGLLGKIWQKAKLENLSLLHVQGNPLDLEDLRAKLDISRCGHSPLGDTQILWSSTPSDSRYYSQPVFPSNAILSTRLPMGVWQNSTCNRTRLLLLYRLTLSSINVYRRLTCLRYLLLLLEGFPVN